MSKKPTRPGGATPAINDIEKRGICYQLHSYDFDPGDLGIGEQAAKALGIAAERLFKTLMVVIDGKQLAVALTPVHAQTHMKTLAAAIGGKRAAMATINHPSRARHRLCQGWHQPLRSTPTASRGDRSNRPEP